jgi:hypothetical protein
VAGWPGPTRPCAIILGWKAVPVDVGGVRDLSRNRAGAAAGGGAIYGLGIFGAWVFFWQQADTFWEYVLAILQGLLWPAFMVYEVFAALA